MSDMGKSDDEIETVINFATREDKTALISNAKETVEKLDLKNKLADDFYNKAIEAGATKSEALANSKLFKVMLGSFGNNTKRIQEWYNKISFVKNMPVEQAQNVLKGGVVYKQGGKEERINDLNARRKELDLNYDSVFDRMDEFREKRQKELLEQKREELEEQGLSHADISEVLADLEHDWRFQNEVEESDGYWDWNFAVDEYVKDYANFLADYCEEKGYITEVEKSKKSISTYIKLYETQEQQEDREPVYEIRISDHENGYGDKDVMIHYSESIEEAVSAVDKTIDNIIGEGFKLNFNSFEEFQEEFKDYIEETPQDYNINNSDEALKDLGITEDKPRVVNTPTGRVEIGIIGIEHIINGGGSEHKPDKNRYKSLNKMFATLERPNIVTVDNNGKKKYFKLFKDNNKSKTQITIVYNDSNGDYVRTTIPVSKDKKYILKEINSGTVIYKNGQTGVIKNNSAANFIINDNTKNFNPPDEIFYQTGNHEIDESDRYKNLPKDLKEAVYYIYTGEPVYDVTGEEFPNNGEDIITRVLKYYKDKFNGSVNNKNLGKIRLNKHSIKDSIYHGKGSNKINAFAAVPYVIEKGMLANTQLNYNNKNENRYLIVAPITLKGEDYFCEVVVREPVKITATGEKATHKNFYIHEVELKEKLADSFTRTLQQGLPTSSKSIISDLINKFNSDEIFYQDTQRKVNPLDYDYIHNQTTGERIYIEMNEGIKVDKIKPQKISSKLPFEISKKPSDNKKSLIKTLGLERGKTIDVVNNNTGEKAKIKDKTIEKSLSNLYRNDKNYSDKIIILNNIADIFKNSQLILSHNNVKTNNFLKTKRYANIANVNGKKYLLEIVGKDNGELLIYSINSIDTDIKNDGNRNASSRNSSQLETVNNSIANIQKILKSKLVQKYNKDYKTLQNIFYQKKKSGINTDSGRKNSLYPNILDLRCRIFDKKYYLKFIRA